MFIQNKELKCYVLNILFKRLKTFLAINHILLLKTQVYFVLCIFGKYQAKDCDVFYLKGITYRKKMAEGNENDKDVLVSRKADFSFHYFRYKELGRNKTSNQLMQLWKAVDVVQEFCSWQIVQQSQNTF